ncbi:MAG: hypothetical protein NTZ05_16165 [Chloroflexi bacterium]|nr:hypothetical protein [Chloroflexota bacterium]
MAMRRTGFIAIPPGRARGFDHADTYQPRLSGAGARLYVAHTGADCVEVIDCATQRHLHALPGLPGVAGVLVHSEQDLLFTSDRAGARASIFRCSDESLVGQVMVGARPNGLAYDPGRKRLFVFNVGDPPGVGSSVSVVALDTLEVVATLLLPGRPRWAAYDPVTDHVYVNIRHPSQIVALNADLLQIAHAFAVPVAGPHGLALAAGRLYCAADAGALVVLNVESGSVEGSVPLPGEPDVIMYDWALGRLYIAVGEPGVIYVVDDQRHVLLETVATERGAHTLGLDPDTHTLYAFMPESEGAAVYAAQ